MPSPGESLGTSSFWRRINPRTKTPTNAVWLAALGALALGLPYLINYTAYAAVLVAAATWWFASARR